MCRNSVASGRHQSLESLPLVALKKERKRMEVITRSEGELCEKLKLVTLRGSALQPYLTAFISIETIHPKNLAPTQRYVLDFELKKIEQLRWDIEKDWGFDILKLNGYLKCSYKNPDGDQPIAEDMNLKREYSEKVIDIIPPVVEEYINPSGGVDLIINDGQHRVFLAYMMGMPINVAYVRGRHSGYPYYAYPLPNGWNDVEIRSDIPEGYIKKFHVAKEHKKLYRNFNSKFENIGDSRVYFTKEQK
jgi:hypothetical protein